MAKGPLGHEDPGRRPRFIADAMLGSLARKLRIFGYDVLYFKDGSDSELEAVAKEQRRVVLTSDRALFAHAGRGGLRAVLVEGKTDRAMLLSVRRQASLSLSAPGASRCAVCNGELAVVSREDAAAAGGTPPKVLARHRLFFRCTSCSKLYWRGGHWARLRRLTYPVERKDLTRRSRARLPVRWSCA